MKNKIFQNKKDFKRFVDKNEKFKRFQTPKKVLKRFLLDSLHWECVHLHRESCFLALLHMAGLGLGSSTKKMYVPGIAWNVHICTKCHVSNPQPIKSPKNIFAGNGMKYSDIHRKIMYGTPIPWESRSISK